MYIKINTGYSGSARAKGVTMLQNCSPSSNRPFFVRGGGGIHTLLFALSLVCAALAFTGCEHDASHPFTDNHELNSGLVGTWDASEEGYKDTYTITVGGRISHNYSYGDLDIGSYNNAEIAYVYNFNRTSGCIIMKYTSGKYNAVYFKNLSKTSVLLGDAYDTENYTNDISVATLDAAKQRFSPANASRWGGADAQTGTPQTRQG
jgi:hypothetical protein